MKNLIVETQTLESLKLEIKSLRAQNISLREYNNELLNETGGEITTKYKHIESAKKSAEECGEVETLESLKLEIEELHAQNASLRGHNDRLFDIKMIMNPIVC